VTRPSAWTFGYSARGTFVVAGLASSAFAGAAAQSNSTNIEVNRIELLLGELDGVEYETVLNVIRGRSQSDGGHHFPIDS
jgi:hypothetical protein